jgi:hypothetical protein
MGKAFALIVLYSVSLGVALAGLIVVLVLIFVPALRSHNANLECTSERLALHLACTRSVPNRRT